MLCSIVKAYSVVSVRMDMGLLSTPSVSSVLNVVYNSTHWTRVPLYILIAYGPLTVFLGVIVVFTISVNSAPLHGWILVCQLLSTNSLMRLLSSIDIEHISPHCITLFLKLLGSTYGIWNLDFFQFIYTPFCLYPSLSTLHVMSLDYIIAAYPLVLISISWWRCTVATIGLWLSCSDPFTTAHTF